MNRVMKVCMKWFAYGTRRYFNNSIRKLDLGLTGTCIGGVSAVLRVVGSCRRHCSDLLCWDD